MNWDEGQSSYGMEAARRVNRLVEELDLILSSHSDPRDIFSEFTKSLEQVYDINKGMLALMEGDQARFLAVATFSRGNVRKNLSLRLPLNTSLFHKVAEHGQMYADNFAELYDGNLIEKRLLLDDDTEAFMLRPLKFEGRVVAMLGYSSENPDAFATFDEGLLDPAIDRFGEAIAKYQCRKVEVRQ